MPATLKSLGLDRLPIEERIALASDLWESIEAEAERSDMTPAQLCELQRRIADDDVTPEDMIPWEQVAAEAIARWSK